MFASLQLWLSSALHKMTARFVQFQQIAPLASQPNRILRRRALCLSLWRLASGLIATVNHLSCCRVGHKHMRATRRGKLAVALPCVAAPCSDVDDDHVSQSHARSHQLTLREAIRFRTARQEALSSEVPLTGVQCVATLIKADVGPLLCPHEDACSRTDESPRH